MGNYFKTHYNAVKYPIDSEKSRGLRNAQLGAIHAISSFLRSIKRRRLLLLCRQDQEKQLCLCWCHI